MEKAAHHYQGPLAVIIGCGDLGMGCARVLGRHHRLLVVDIAADRLDAATATLRHEGYAVDSHVCDISNPDQVDALGQSLADGPGVRVLAHVAALGNTPEGWRAVVRVDLVGAHLIARAVGPHMVRGGVAILISSTGSHQSRRDPGLDELLDNPFVPDLEQSLIDLFGREPDFLEAYFLSKRGVNRLAEALAIEWGESDVRALSVSPGLIDSTMGRTGGAMVPAFDGGVKRLVSRSEKARLEVPLQRQGSLLEITSVVEFLASDAASFVNGIDIPVDGGSVAFWRKQGVINSW